MGYMGLDNWRQSDNAAGLYEIIAKLRELGTSKEEINRVLEMTMENIDMGSNTPGFINIALLMEDGILKAEDVSPTIIAKMEKCFIGTIEICKDEKGWGNMQESRVMHLEACERMLKFVTEACKV